MKIRKVKKEKLKEIAELFEKRMKKHFKDVKEEPISVKKYEKILNENFGRSKMYVLENNKIKGFIWYFKEDKELNLEEIFITEKGKGYGKMLIKHLIEDAKKQKVRKINLDVHFKNKKAQKFFKKFGFSERTIEMSLDLK